MKLFELALKDHFEKTKTKANLEIEIIQKADKKKLKEQVDEKVENERRNFMERYLDPLTTLPNPRFFRQAFYYLTRDYLYSGNDFYVVMIDLDCFKNINDTYSHAAGDEYLRTVTDFLQNSKLNLVARTGGDEFIALTKEDNSQRTIFEFSQKLNNIVVRLEDRIRVGASIGYSHTSEIKQLAQKFRQQDIGFFNNFYETFLQYVNSLPSNPLEKSQLADENSPVIDVCDVGTSQNKSQRGVEIKKTQKLKDFGKSITPTKELLNTISRLTMFNIFSKFVNRDFHKTFQDDMFNVHNIISVLQSGLIGNADTRAYFAKEAGKSSLVGLDNQIISFKKLKI